MLGTKCPLGNAVWGGGGWTTFSFRRLLKNEGNSELKSWSVYCWRIKFKMRFFRESYKFGMNRQILKAYRVFIVKFFETNYFWEMNRMTSELNMSVKEEIISIQLCKQTRVELMAETERVQQNRTSKGLLSIQKSKTAWGLISQTIWS